MANPNPSPATRFKPGESANPGGRPKWAKISEAMRRFGDAGSVPNNPKTVAEQLAAAAIRRARTKSDRALELVMDRTEGKVPQAHEVSGPGGSPLVGDALADRVAALLAKAKGK